MAFIRKRGGSHQLVETYREDGKVKQRVLANLCGADSLPKALEVAERNVRMAESEVASIEAHIKVAKAAVKERRKRIAKWEAEQAELPENDRRPWYELREPENQGVPHAWPYYRDPHKQAQAVAEMEAKRPQIRASWKQQWEAFGVPDEGSIDEGVSKIIIEHTHVTRRLTLHTLQKMLPTAKQALTRAKRELANLRKVRGA